MRRLHAFAALLVLLSTLLLAGCATDRRNESLTRTLNAYGGVIRWGDFGNALQFIDPKVRAEKTPSPLEMSRYDQYRVTGYDDGQGPAPNGDNEVRQIVAISLVNNNTQVERTVIDRQTWRYDQEANRWWLVSGLPNISAQ
jgi:hypothetical protein